MYCNFEYLVYGDKMEIVVYNGEFSLPQNEVLVHQREKIIVINQEQIGGFTVIGSKLCNWQ